MSAVGGDVLAELAELRRQSRHAESHAAAARAREAAAVRRAVAGGASLAEVARAIGVSRQRVWTICRRGAGS